MSFGTMPVSLIVSFIVFFGFVNTHQRHIRAFQGSSQRFYIFLNIYFIASCLLGLGFLVYYGYCTSWYLPIILFFVSGIIGGIIFGILDGVVGSLQISVLGFIGVPISSYFMFTSIPKFT